MNIDLPEPVMDTKLPLPNPRRGKVRDIYDCTLKDGRDALLIVATDRISAFDAIMQNGIPDKGKLLTEVATHWFESIETHFEAEAGHQLPHHLLSVDPEDVQGLSDQDVSMLRGQVMIGQRCEVIKLECVARGYLAGSGWAEYQQSQSICGQKLPVGLQQCAKLPSPIFTPTTKADEGHDMPVTFEEACDLVGEAVAKRLRDITLSLYEFAHARAAQRGLILADTKFEFGVPVEKAKAGRPIDPEDIVLIDEALTPDSSRYWPADDYEPGRDQASFDKQFVRNYLQDVVDAGQWDKTPPGPVLPNPIIEQTLERYREAVARLFGSSH